MKRIFPMVLFLFFRSILDAEPSERIVSLNGSVTEILFQLGLGEKIIGIDTSSTFPKETSKIKQVGYQRILSSEGILSFSPTFVIGTESAGPASTLDQIRQTSVPLLILSDEFSAKGVEEKIRKIANSTNKQVQGEKLINEFNTQISTFKKPNLKKPIKVLFIYSRGATNLFVSGKKTAPDAMIHLSGATNAISEFDDYKPLTTESLVANNPDIILLTKHSFDMIGGGEAIWEISGIKSTRAGKEKNLIVMDDLLLLGFGPRLPTALNELGNKWKSID
ncbi:MAG: hemin ABC transporter substrate-binding protein [Leptospira sp.]|nr:hemin ABC transporter substrate-binding protein [Leptospira sp.]